MLNAALDVADTTTVTPQDLKTTQPHGPAPELQPDPNSPSRTVLNPDDPRWVQVRELRQRAWDRGITHRELFAMFSGYCSDQITTQISLLTNWLATH